MAEAPATDVAQAEPVAEAAAAKPKRVRRRTPKAGDAAPETTVDTTDAPPAPAAAQAEPAAEPAAVVAEPEPMPAAAPEPAIVETAAPDEAPVAESELAEPIVPFEVKMIDRPVENPKGGWWRKKG